MSKTPSEPKNLLLQIMALMIILLLATAVYHALRPGIGRLTADFFYPYLKVSRVAVNTISDRTLLSFSRAELAAKLEQQQKLNETLAFQAAAAEELAADDEKQDNTRNDIGNSHRQTEVRTLWHGPKFRQGKRTHLPLS